MFWSFFHFAKCRLFILQRNSSFDALQSLTFALGSLFNHSVYVTYTAFRVKDIRGDVLYRVYNICGIISTILSAVSVLTSTAISVDRLLVLMLEMRYRHVVTLDRVRGVVIGFWLLGASTLPVWLWSKENFYRGLSLIVLLCLITSTSCYVKIHLTLWKHHAQINVQNHFLEQPNERGGSPLNIARYKKNTVQHFMGASGLTCLLYSL